jgi:hypothetical protein
MPSPYLFRFRSAALGFLVDLRAAGLDARFNMVRRDGRLWYVVELLGGDPILSIGGIQ